MALVQRKPLSGLGRESHAYGRQALTSEEIRKVKKMKQCVVMLLAKEKFESRDSLLAEISDNTRKRAILICERVRRF